MDRTNTTEVLVCIYIYNKQNLGKYSNALSNVYRYMRIHRISCDNIPSEVQILKIEL